MDRLEKRRGKERVRSEYVSDLPQYVLRKPFYYLAKFLIKLVVFLQWFFGFKFSYEIRELERYVWLRKVDLPEVKVEKKSTVN